MKALTKSLKLSIQLPSPTSSSSPSSLSKLRQRRLIDNKSTSAQITDNIFLSGYLPANDLSFLSQNNITSIINCAYRKDSFAPYIQYSDKRYLLLPLRDNSNAEIFQLFYSTIDFIEKAKEGNTLIHCIEGISRGPALLAGYLMWKKNIPKEEAIKLIKSKRECVEMNLGFMIQLGLWETHLLSKGMQFFSLKANGDITLLVNRNEFDLVLKHDLPKTLLCIKYNRRLFLLNKAHWCDDIVIDNYVYFMKQYDNSISEIKVIDYEDEAFQKGTKDDSILETLTLPQ